MSKKGPGKQTRHLPAFILLFLWEEDLHGGAILSKLSELVPPEWSVDSGAIYRSLRELESDGFVISEWSTEDVGPAKRIYRITDAGKAELSIWYKDILLRRRNLDYFIREYESKQRTEG